MQVNFVGFTPDQERVVSASDDKTIRVFEAKSGIQLGLIAGKELIIPVPLLPLATCHRFYHYRIVKVIMGR